MRIALAQIDVKLGDVPGNLARAAEQIDAAVADGAGLVVFPELALSGFALGAATGETRLAADDDRLLALGRRGAEVVIGFHELGPHGRPYNSSVWLGASGARHLQRKLYLPNYGPFEERKHALPGQGVRAFETPLGRAAMLVCADAWQPVIPWLAAQDGARVLVVIANSADGAGRIDIRASWDDLLRATARLLQVTVVYVNRVGDEQGSRFRGGSHILDPWGGIVAQAPEWNEALVACEVDLAAVDEARGEMPLVREARLDLVAREVARLVDEGGDR